MGCRMRWVEVGYLTGTLKEKGQGLPITSSQTNGSMTGRTTAAQHPSVVDREGGRAVGYL